jgi:hypothetical protein
MYDGGIFNPNNNTLEDYEDKIEIVFENTKYNHW